MPMPVSIITFIIESIRRPVIATNGPLVPLSDHQPVSKYTLSSNDYRSL